MRKKGKFEQPRTLPVEKLPEQPQRVVPPMPEVLPEDAPTMQVPVIREPQQWQEPVQPRPAYVPEEPEQPETRRPAIHGGVLAAIIAGSLVLLCLLGVLIWGMVLKGGDAIYPNVYVAGINVGGMERAEAVDAVDEAVTASYSSSTLSVQLPDRTISFQPEQTNVALDADEAIAEALAYGRSGNPFSAVASYLAAGRREYYIDLQTILDLDTDYIRRMIEDVAVEISQTPQSSRVSVNEDAGTITVDVGYPDRSLDVDGLAAAVEQAFMTGSFDPLVWTYHEVPCEMVDLTPYYQQYCTEMADAYYDEEARIIREEVIGYGFDLEAANQQLAMAAPGSQVVIQMEELEPEITKLELEKELFGTSIFTKSTVYVNNSNRTNNLRLACEALNGTILNPGDVFSFNDIVGERTAAKGYLPATVYSGGKSLEELGGGVCQVASTIYYVTLHMDLEQVEREPHMFAVTYVDLGMDATIYWGSLDYKFKNTLDYPIKLQANVDGGTCNITFWGSKPLDKKVEMSYAVLATIPWEEVEELDEEKPVGFREEKETPYTGYKVVTYKTIYDLDGNQISREQEAYSEYNKRDHTFIVGPPEEEDPFGPEGEDPLDPDDPDGSDPTDPVDPEDGGETVNPWLPSGDPLAPGA